MKQPDLLRALDHPRVNSAIFFPRRDTGLPAPAGSEDLRIQVAPGISVATRYHPHPKLHAGAAPMLLHFHGNGEIVSDYDNIAPLFHAAGTALVSVDYRGYGQSDGEPTARALVEDAHAVLDFILALRRERGLAGPLAVMGRSLGSAPAVELAATRGNDIAGLVLESGFASTPDLLALFGLSLETLGVSPEGLDDNENKMAQVQCPILLLHAQGDQLIQPWHAKRNLEAATVARKKLVMIPSADHNTIMVFGGRLYWGGLADFIAGL